MSEVKKIPKLRFVQYSDLLTNVGFTDLGKIMIGLTHTPNYIETGRPFLSSKNISQGFIDFENMPSRKASAELKTIEAELETE